MVLIVWDLPVLFMHLWIRRRDKFIKVPVGNLLPKVFATISALLSRGSGCYRMPTGHLLIFMLAEDFIMYSFKPSASGDYVAAFDVAATVIINSLIKKGAKYIRLHDDLYDILGAESKAEQTAVRMAVRKAKASGLIVKTQIDTIYGVK